MEALHLTKQRVNTLLLEESFVTFLYGYPQFESGFGNVLDTKVELCLVKYFHDLKYPTKIYILNISLFLVEFGRLLSKWLNFTKTMEMEWNWVIAAVKQYFAMCNAILFKYSNKMLGSKPTCPYLGIAIVPMKISWESLWESLYIIKKHLKVEIFYT